MESSNIFTLSDNQFNSLLDELVSIRQICELETSCILFLIAGLSGLLVILVLYRFFKLFY